MAASSEPEITISASDRAAQLFDPSDDGTLFAGHRFPGGIEEELVLLTSLERAAIDQHADQQSRHDSPGQPRAPSTWCEAFPGYLPSPRVIWRIPLVSEPVRARFGRLGGIIALKGADRESSADSAHRGTGCPRNCARGREFRRPVRTGRPSLGSLTRTTRNSRVSCERRVQKFNAGSKSRRDRDANQCAEAAHGDCFGSRIEQLAVIAVCRRS